MRDTPQARRFIQLWHEVNVKFFKNPKLHQIWRKRYRGMNQPAFGYLLKHPEKHGCRMQAIPCLKYNACDQEWARIGDDVLAVHLKKALRKCALHGGPIPKGAKKAMTIWHKYGK